MKSFAFFLTAIALFSAPTTSNTTFIKTTKRGTTIFTQKGITTANAALAKTIHLDPCTLIMYLPAVETETESKHKTRTRALQGIAQQKNVRGLQHQSKYDNYMDCLVIGFLLDETIATVITNTRTNLERDILEILFHKTTPHKHSFLQEIRELARGTYDIGSWNCFALQTAISAAWPKDSDSDSDSDNLCAAESGEKKRRTDDTETEKPNPIISC